MRKIVIILLLFVSLMVYGQSYPVIDGIPRDTSFNPSSAFKKAFKKYPFIKQVKSHLPDGVGAEYNVVYSSISGRDLHLDLFKPDNPGNQKTPVVLFIHGGGWASGSKEHMVPMAQKLAGKGFVTIAAEYRLSPEAKYPAAIHDLKIVIKWLKANRSKYGIDTNRIAALGCSAGATLASILGTTTGINSFEMNDDYKSVSSRIQAVINIDGILDFTNPVESGKDTILGKPSAGTRWFGATYSENPGIWREASPINYLDSSTSPFLFVNSSLDRYHAGRDSLINTLSRLGIYTEIHTIPNTPHPFWLFEPWFETAFSYVLEFLEKIFPK